jgi:hypothetical protein
MNIPPQSTIGSIRHHVRINRPADIVWPWIADPARLADWFPGLVTSRVVEGTWERRVTTPLGIEMVEDVVNIDSTIRRFQYKILPNFVVRKHLATVDVLEVDDNSCIVVYSTDLEPRAFALAIGSGTFDAINELKRQVEAIPLTKG